MDSIRILCWDTLLFCGPGDTPDGTPGMIRLAFLADNRAAAQAVGTCLFTVFLGESGPMLPVVRERMMMLVAFWWAYQSAAPIDFQYSVSDFTRASTSRCFPFTFSLGWQLQQLGTSIGGFPLKRISKSGIIFHLRLDGKGPFSYKRGEAADNPESPLYPPIQITTRLIITLSGTRTWFRSSSPKIVYPREISSTVVVIQPFGVFNGILSRMLQVIFAENLPNYPWAS